MNTKRSIKVAALLGATMLCSTGVAQAQIDEIIVTATKKETFLQKTPIAVTAVTGAELEAKQIEGVDDIQYLVPSLVLAEVGDQAQISLRGVGTEIATSLGDPSVAIHVDGVYRGGLTSSLQTFFDMEQLEVLRGPQGTLFGRNTTGGSINVATRGPGDVPAFEADVLAGNFGRIKTKVAGDLPVSENFALRGAFLFDKNSGQRTNGLTGEDIDDSNVKIGRLTAQFTPSDAVEVVVRGELYDGESGGAPFTYIAENPVGPLFTTPLNPGGALTFPNPALGGASLAQVFGLTFPAGAAVNTDPQTPSLDSDTSFDREGLSLNGTVTWDMGGVELKSISSYFDLDQVMNSDTDGTELNFFNQVGTQGIKEISQEFNLSGTAADGNLDWIVGAFYYDSEVTTDFLFGLPALQTTFEAFFGLGGPGMAPLPPGSLAFFGNDSSGASSAVPFIEYVVNQDTQSIAAFGQGTYNLTDKLRVTGGLRWTQDEKEVDYTVLDNIGGGTCQNLIVDDNWSEVTGRGGLDYDASENVFLYGSVSRGFKAGGYNFGSCNNSYDPETVWAYEAGFKTNLADRRLQLNGAAFYYDYSDYQSLQFQGATSFVRNAANAEIYGVELEVAAQIAENFRIDGHASLLHAEFKDFSGLDPNFPALGIQDLQGNRLTRAPKYTVGANATYTADLGTAGSLQLRGEYSYTDDVFHTVFNNEIARQEGYSLGNLRAIYTPGGDLEDHWSLTAFVENVGDKDYTMNILPNSLYGGATAQFAPPRTYGMQVSYKWGGE